MSRKPLSGRMERTVDGLGVRTFVEIPVGRSTYVAACRQEIQTFLKGKHVAQESRTIGTRALLQVAAAEVLALSFISSLGQRRRFVCFGRDTRTQQYTFLGSSSSSS